MKSIETLLLFLLVLCEQKNVINVESEKFIETFFMFYKLLDRDTLFELSTDL